MTHTWKTRWIVFASAVVLIQLCLTAALPRGFALAGWADGSQFLLVALVCATSIRNACTTRDDTRLFWVWMSAGSALWTVVQWCWALYEVVLRQPVPNPFLADIVLFLHMVPFMGALAVQPHRKKDQNGIAPGTLDFVLLLLWWVYLYVFLVIPWQYLALDVIRYGSAFNVLYLIEHVVFLLSIGYLYLHSTGKWRELYRQMLTAGLIYAVASLAANIAMDLPAASSYSYYSGSLYDVPLLISLLYWVYVSLLPRQLGEMEPEQEPRQTHGVWSARVAMFAVLSLPVFGICVLLFPSTSERIQTFRLAVTCAAVFLLAGLLFLKQHLMQRRLIASLEESQRAYGNLRDLQRHLLQAEKLASIGRLVAGAAHEINNPLTAILGYSDLLATHSDIQDHHRDMADKIRQQARRTKNLVLNLLTFAKQTPGQRSMVDLNAVAIGALQLRELDLARTKVETVTDFAAGLPPVQGDENHLKQVCLHIFNNAVEAMQEADGSGTLTVSTSLENGRLVLRCADTGPGIADPERIFDPFFTTKAPGKGTGLGLSTCYGIIREHGGEIVCENLPDKGALFSIFLPIADARVAATELVIPTSA